MRLRGAAFFLHAAAAGVQSSTGTGTRAGAARHLQLHAGLWAFSSAGVVAHRGWGASFSAAGRPDWQGSLCIRQGGIARCCCWFVASVFDAAAAGHHCTHAHTQRVGAARACCCSALQPNMMAAAVALFCRLIAMSLYVRARRQHVVCGSVPFSSGAQVRGVVLKLSGGQAAIRHRANDTFLFRLS